MIKIEYDCEKSEIILHDPINGLTGAFGEMCKKITARGSLDTEELRTQYPQFTEAFNVIEKLITLFPKFKVSEIPTRTPAWGPFNPTGIMIKQH